MKKNYFSTIVLFLLSLTSIFAQTRVTGWFAVNTATETFPVSAFFLDPSVISSGTHNYSGMTTYDDSREYWYFDNAETSVNTATAPYISYTITLSASSVSFDRFVFPSLAGNGKSQLRWDVDGFASSLGDFTMDPGGNWTLTSVNLSSLPPVTNSTVEFRIYGYNYGPYGLIAIPGGTGYATFDGTPALYDVLGSASIWITSFVTSTQDISKNKIDIYPTISKGFFTVTNAENASINVFDISGKSVLEIPKFSGNQIDLSNYAKGMYFVKINNTIQKVVVE